MVEKPDVLVCQKCHHRFQKAKFISVEEDGIIVTQPACPKCESTNLIASSWFIDENSGKKSDE